MPQPDDLLRRADHWIFAAEDPRRLASVRIGLCGVLALRLATTNYRVVAAQPAALFQPVSYMKLLGRMPSQGIASSLQIFGIVAAGVAASGLASRAGLSVSVMCSLVLDGMLNSAGRIIVGDAVLTLCLLILLTCGTAASDAWTLRGPLRRTYARWSGGPAAQPAVSAQATEGSERYGWPIRTAMVVIALTFFFAGFQKLRYSGLAWVTSDSFRWILYSSSDRSVHANAIALFIADRAWLAHLCAAGTLLLETCFPLALFMPRLRWLFVVGVVAMHEAIRLAIGLDYSAQGLTVLIVFVDWPAVVTWLRPRPRRATVEGLELVMSARRTRQAH